MSDDEYGCIVSVRMDERRKGTAMGLARKKGMTLSTLIRTLLYEKLDEEAAKTA